MLQDPRTRVETRTTGSQSNGWTTDSKGRIVDANGVVVGPWTRSVQRAHQLYWAVRRSPYSRTRT